MPTARLILGCGYLGGFLVPELLANPGPVVVTSRSPIRLDPQAGHGSVTGLQFTPEADPAPLVAAMGAADAVDVYCLLTPSALASDAVRAQLAATLRGLPLRRAVLASSTGIYNASHGQSVTAESPPGAAPGEREQRLAAIEAFWQALPGARVVRLAGLYGPGRLIGAEALRAGTRLPGSPDAWLNLIHVADAAALLCRVAATPEAAAVEIGGDGTPLRRGDYYAALAKLLGVAPPVFEATVMADPGKRVDPASTWQRLGWRPRMRDFREGLQDALARPVAVSRE